MFYHIYIDPEDKPFGAVLPIEIQQRIMFWVRIMEKRPLHDTILSLPVCELTDWVARLERGPFKALEREYKCTLQDVCRWCFVYEHEMQSLHELCVTRKIQKNRTEVFLIDNGSDYHEWEKPHLKSLYDAKQFTMHRVFLPSIGYVKPRTMARHPLSRSLGSDTEITLYEIEVAAISSNMNILARMGEPPFINHRKRSEIFFKRRIFPDPYRHTCEYRKELAGPRKQPPHCKKCH